MTVNQTSSSELLKLNAGTADFSDKHVHPVGLHNQYIIFTGPSDSGGLSTGGITGIVFAVIFVIFFVLPFGWVFGKDYWRKRHQYGWYNRLTTPSEWCDCDGDCDCFSQPTRTTFQLRPNTSEVTVVSETTEPVVNEPEVTVESNTVSQVVTLFMTSPYFMCSMVPKYEQSFIHSSIHLNYM